MEVITPRVLPPAGTKHSVRFYLGDDQLVEEVASFLDDALRAGGRAVAIATPAHRAAVTRVLSGFGGPAEVWQSGRLVMLDASETLDRFMSAGAPDAERFEEVITPLIDGGNPDRPVNAFGEMVAVLCERCEYEAALAVEALWNGLLARHTFSLFCGYPLRLFSCAERANGYQHFCACHSDVLVDGASDAAPDQGGEPADVEELRLQHAAMRVELRRSRRSEEILRARNHELAEFLDNACEGIHKVAADGTILYANRAELDMLGYTWEEYVGRNIAEFYVDQGLICQILERLQHGDSLNDQQAVLRCKDGSHKAVRIHSNGCFDNGQLRYTRCFTRDGSEREALDAALVERSRIMEELREASRAKDEFLAMLGHELRNPLSPILTALKLMRIRGGGTFGEQEVIERQVQHMVRLVDDLLDVSRITRGKIELKYERVELASLVQKAVEQVMPLLEQRQHRLRVSVEERAVCECDPVRISQVVANLLTNAARYTQPGGQIEIEAETDSDRTFAIRVRDNGIGIPAETLPRVFELFYQAERSLERSQGGLGIGLALVKSLVELHGGAVQASSAGRGCGSEFLVRLPIASTRGERMLVAASPFSPVEISTTCKVMIVDDNVDAAETLALLLQAHGHETWVFHEPAAALAAVGEIQPHAAVLDIGLPVMDGYALGERVRSICGERCILIALTGYGRETDRNRSAGAGFQYHLVKPVAADEVLRILEAHPEARRKNRVEPQGMPA